MKGKNIDYLALGHVHSYKLSKLDDRGVYCYSGCLEGRGFDECGQKGFVVLDIAEGHISTEFVSIAKRTIHDIEVAIEDDMQMIDVVDAVKAATDDIPDTDMIQLNLVGQIGEDMAMHMDVDRIRRQVLDRFYASRIKEHLSVAIDFDSYKLDKSLKGEFVRLMDQTDIDEESKNSIIELGLKAILGEEITI